MSKIILTIVTVFFSSVVFSQNQTVQIAYGGSFAGFGDLQGRFMSIGLQHSFGKKISIYGSLNKSSMSGNKLSYLYAGKPFLGLDYFSESILDINDIFHNTDLQNDKLNSIGSSYSYDPPFSIINETHFDLGANISLLKKGKFNYYIQGNLSLVKLEVTGTSTNKNVYINNESWVNQPERVEVGLMTSFQDHFLDLGYGYGIGIDYNLYDYFIIGANGHYNQYLNDAQNFVTWGFKLGLKI